jgi:hypothetical protein
LSVVLLFRSLFSFSRVVASYIQYSCGDYSAYQNLNVLHVAAKFGSVSAARALLEFIVMEKVKPNRYLDDDGGGLATVNPMKGKETFLTQLFQGRLSACGFMLGV